MTYEQHGSGLWGVRIIRSDYSGQFRFETEAEARAYQKEHGGRVFHSRRPMGDIYQVGDRADLRPARSAR